MVNYLDTAVGHIVDALQAKGMWENTLWVFQSDNGGPSFTGDNHTANNYPLKGAKYTNWQGGIRVNAFVAGGYLVKVAPGVCTLDFVVTVYPPPPLRPFIDLWRMCVYTSMTDFGY